MKDGLPGSSTTGQVQISAFTPHTPVQQLSAPWVKEERGSPTAWWSLSKAEGLSFSGSQEAKSTF